MSAPATLTRDISPPSPSNRGRKRRKPSLVGTRPHNEASLHTGDCPVPSVAAVEAGKAKVENHLAYFRERLSRVCRETDEIPRISIEDWTLLYEGNSHEHGNHFVIHQHDHPVSGVHYDLRLQFSKTSSISFAVPKGLPGDPNSKSLGRLAIETRVHNVWNHLIESASYKSGSLLIWDTGTYTILPRKLKKPPPPQTTDDETDVESEGLIENKPLGMKDENERLIDAFQNHRIRIRLHGTRLPDNYTVTMRLSSTDNTSGACSLHRKRRWKSELHATSIATDSEQEADMQLQPKDLPQKSTEPIDTDDEESALTRLDNAYPGAANSIGSLHQRHWFMLLDRTSSGFVRDDSNGGKWRRDCDSGFEPFYVRGRDMERSVVTGRLAAEVEHDEGIEGFVGRRGWRGILC